MLTTESAVFLTLTTDSAVLLTLTTDSAVFLMLTTDSAVFLMLTTESAVFLMLTTESVKGCAMIMTVILTVDSRQYPDGIPQDIAIRYARCLIH
eukprot:207933-Amorphochlora_amoeboformis.AAC.1